MLPVNTTRATIIALSILPVFVVLGLWLWGEERGRQRPAREKSTSKSVKVGLSGTSGSVRKSFRRAVLRRAEQSGA